MFTRRPFMWVIPAIDLKLWVDEFSEALCGRKVRVASATLLRPIAVFGQVLNAFHPRFPLTSFRLDNMTEKNDINMQQTLAITGPSPYSLSDGVEETVKWYRESLLEC